MNLKVRFKNPVFIFSLILSILTPILAYLGITVENITTWAKLGEILLNAVSNPYVLGLVIINVYNTLIDPTTKGVKDSENALTYTEPK